MRYLHTMVRVNDLQQSLEFYTTLFGLVEIRRQENEQGRYTLVFLAAPEDMREDLAHIPALELTWNWDEKSPYSGGRNFGHLAYEVEDIYQFCQHLMNHGIVINRPPRDGYMAFVKSPDGISIEILQKGDRLKPQEPWASMENTGSW